MHSAWQGDCLPLSPGEVGGVGDDGGDGGGGGGGGGQCEKHKGKTQRHHSSHLVGSLMN